MLPPRFLVPRSVLVWLLVALGASGCRAEPATPPATNDDRPVLVLAGEPLLGAAPLEVRFTARAEGVDAKGIGSDCPSGSFDFGDGDVQLVAATCEDESVVLVAVHRFDEPGVYEVTATLLGVDTRAASVLQVKAEGAAPTPMPEAGLRFPPRVDLGPRVSPVASRAASGPQPTAPAGTEAAIPVAEGIPLPADLIYVDSDGAAWRLPADGAGRAPVTDGPVAELAVAPTGEIALLEARGVRVFGATGTNGRLIATGGRSLAWDANGTVLAFADDTVKVYFPLDDVVVDTGLRGDALAVAFDGATLQLVLRDPDGGLRLYPSPAEVVAPPDRAPTTLPLPLDDVDAAGWIPGQQLVWLSGKGLRLLTAEDPLQITDLVTEAVVDSVRVKGDTLLFVEQSAGVTTPGSASLASGTKAALGPPLDVALGGTVRLAPDGRTAALIRDGRLLVVDLASGAEVPVADSAATAKWAERRGGASGE